MFTDCKSSSSLINKYPVLCWLIILSLPMLISSYAQSFPSSGSQTIKIYPALNLNKALLPKKLTCLSNT